MRPIRRPLATVDLNAVQNSDQISMGGGVWLPTRLVVHYDDPARPFVAICEFVLPESGTRPVCSAIKLERRMDQEIDAASLRLPLQKILRDATAYIAPLTGGPDAPAGILRSSFEKSQAFVGGPHRRAREAKIAYSAMRQSLTPDFLQRVADLYREAVRDGKSPRLFIAETLARSPRATLTARNWIQAARRHGYLGEAMPGKAGEIVPPRKTRHMKQSKRRSRP